jgi:ankyrin repeat protein
LYETYKRTLEEIPEEKRRYTRRLFQCLVAAIRPLRVEDLAEIFAIEFGQDSTSNFKESWRPENPEEAVFSACSTLITVTEDEGSKIVQFSHFSVKEFLTSERLRTTNDANIRHYYIPLDAAHTMLARTCLTVLVQLDEKVDKKRLATFPLAFYAAQHWVDHVKYEDVASRVQDVMERLFDPGKPHLAAWAWIYDVERGQVRDSIDALPESPTPRDATALYYAVLCGFSGLAEHLIVAHTEYVNAKCGRHGTALHAASYMGHLDAARVLLHHGAHVNMTNGSGRAPLCVAYNGGHLEVMRLLLEHGANGDAMHDSFGRLLHDASYGGQAEATQLLLQHNADVNARGHDGRTPLHWASTSGHAKVAQLLLEYGADVNSLSMTEQTPLYLASLLGHLEVVQVLLKHGADVSIRGGYQTPLRAASDAEVVQLLHGAYRG